MQRLARGRSYPHVGCAATRMWRHGPWRSVAAMITILLIAGILLLAVALVAFAAFQALAEHWANDDLHRRHGRRLT